MTSKELFETYAGKEVRYVKKLSDSCWAIGEYVRIVGYNTFHDAQVLMERKGHPSNIHNYSNGYVQMLECPSSVWEANKDCFDWTDVKGRIETPSNICCRCGRVYTNKKKHRVECK